MNDMRSIMRGLLLWVLLLLSGCSIIDTHEKPLANWPQLKEFEHYVSAAEMRDVCSPAVSWLALGMVDACAWVHFNKCECHMWFNNDVPPSTAVVEHERLHCKGHDHIGSFALRDAWKTWDKYNVTNCDK